jgi:hypothetical protein
MEYQMVTKFPEYMELVLHELEILRFPDFTFAATIMGVPEKAIAQYMQLMMRASFMQDETPQYCASQIHAMFVQTFENALMDIIMGHIHFPSE